MSDNKIDNTTGQVIITPKYRVYQLAYVKLCWPKDLASKNIFAQFDIQSIQTKSVANATTIIYNGEIVFQNGSKEQFDFSEEKLFGDLESLYKEYNLYTKDVIMHDGYKTLIRADYPKPSEQPIFAVRIATKDQFDYVTQALEKLDKKFSSDEKKVIQFPTYINVSEKSYTVDQSTNLELILDFDTLCNIKNLKPTSDENGRILNFGDKNKGSTSE